MKDRVFLDAVYAIAVTVTNDQYHERAVALAWQMKAEGTRLITTRAVVLEIGNALSKMRYRQAAVGLLDALEQDALVEIVPTSEEVCQRAFRLYKNRSDKEWGLTDCISFIIMQDQNLTEALTADEHFQQAGFEALLREL
ncbi:MAG: PIN domain-containing protein [Pyrinomonadaceae bacterium]